MYCENCSITRDKMKRSFQLAIDFMEKDLTKLEEEKTINTSRVKSRFEVMILLFQDELNKLNRSDEIEQAYKESIVIQSPTQEANVIVTGLKSERLG